MDEPIYFLVEPNVVQDIIEQNFFIFNDDLENFNDLNFDLVKIQFKSKSVFLDFFLQQKHVLFIEPKYKGNDSHQLKEPFQNQLFFLISGKNSIDLVHPPKYVYLPSDLRPLETLNLKKYLHNYLQYPTQIDFQTCSELNSGSDHKKDLFQYVLNQIIVPPIFLFMGPSRFKHILQTYFIKIPCIDPFLKSAETSSIFKFIFKEKNQVEIILLYNASNPDDEDQTSCITSYRGLETLEDQTFYVVLNATKSMQLSEEDISSIQKISYIFLKNISRKNSS